MGLASFPLCHPLTVYKNIIIYITQYVNTYYAIFLNLCYFFHCINYRTVTIYTIRIKRYTEAQARATRKYLSNVGEYKLRTNKKEIEGYKSVAEQTGMNLNKYII